MDTRNPKIWARVDPRVRERVRTESARLFDGNESMLVRKAVVRYLDEIEERRRRAAALSIGELVADPEPEAIPA